MDTSSSKPEDKKKQPLDTSMTKRMLKDAVIYAPSSFVPAIISILSLVIYTRKFSPTQYGVYVLFISTINVINLVVSTWIQFVILRYRAEYLNDAKIDDFNSDLIFLLSLISFFLLMVSAVGLAIFYSITGSLNNIVPFAIGYLIINAWYSNLCFVLMADLKSKKYTSFAVANACLAFLLAIAFIFAIRADISFIILGMLLSELALAAPLVYSTGMIKARRRRIMRLKAHFKANYLPFLRKAFAYGFPMIGWLIGVELLNVLDRYIIEAFRGSVEVGIYSPNYSLAIGVLGLVATPISFAAHSLIMKESSLRLGNPEGTRDMIRDFSKYYLLFTIPIFVFLSLNSKDLAKFFLGEEYWGGYVIIPIVSFGYLAWNFAVYGHKGFELKEKTKTMLFYVGICITLNVVLNLILIPLAGYKGAAVTTLISLSLYPILVYFGSRHIFPWEIPWRSLFNIIVSSTCMSIAIVLYRTFSPLQSNITNLIISFCISFAVYGVAIYSLKEFKSLRLSMLKAFLGSRKHDLI